VKPLKTSQDIWGPGQDKNRVRPKYKTRTLPLQPTSPVMTIKNKNKHMTTEWYLKPQQGGEYFNKQMHTAYVGNLLEKNLSLMFNHILSILHAISSIGI
jgi:hypothetical protein